MFQLLKHHSPVAANKLLQVVGVRELQLDQLYSKVNILSSALLENLHSNS